MIVKLCKVGSQPRRLMDYLGRTARPNAFLLDANVPGGSPSEWAGWIADVSQRYRPRKGEFVKHFVLSYATGEHPPDDEMRQTVRFFLDRMGYGEAPFVAFLHKDTDNHHVHIVTTPTTWEGKAISEAFDKVRCVRIAREIEERWNRVRVEAPEAAFLKSPSQGEMQRAAKGEESMRAVFQVEVAQAARDSGTFVEFLERLRGRGFSTHTLLDKDGVLRGISFARGDQAFKGSQLGRAFRAGKLLSTFELAYDPVRNRPEVLRLAGGERAQGQKPAPAAREPLSLREALRNEPDGAEDLRQLDRHPDLPARQLVSLDWLRAERGLPGGDYIVLPLTPREIASGLGRIEARSLDGVRRDLTLQEALAEARRAERSGAAAILARRAGEDRSRLVAYRDLSAEQVVTLRSHGFEPAVLVRAGERYDLWLRSPEALSEEEQRALRQHLADHYGIAPPRGFFFDAIRLPGSSFEAAGERVRVRLAETRDEPFTASRTWLDELRGEGRQALRERLPRLDTPSLEAPLARADAAQYRSLPDSPSPSLLGGLEVRIEALRRREPRGTGDGATEPVEDFIARARRINQEAIVETLGRTPGGSRDASDRLVAIEGELAGRIREARGVFESSRGKMLSAWQRTETAAASVEAAPSLERIYAYQVLAHSYGLARAEMEQAEHAYSRLALAQVSLHRERFGWALVERERPAEAWSAYERLIRREAALTLQLGLGEPARPQSSSELRKRLDALEARGAGLRFEGPERWPEVEASFRARVTTQLLLERAEARKVVSDLGRRFSLLATREPPEALRDYGLSRIGASERATVEEAMAVQAATAPERLLETTSRVAAGDLSPEALRRLNAALLLEVPPNRITLPVVSPTADPRAGLDALARLAPEILREAQRLAEGDALGPERAVRLFAASAEAVAWLRHLDRQQRASSGLPEPGRPPKEVSELAWRAAWVEVVAGKGMTPQVAASHLGNLARASPEAAPRALDMAVSWGLSLGRTLSRSAGRWVQAVVAEGEERQVNLRR